MREAKASATLDPAFRVGEIDPRLFGSFVEHMGRCVYTGVFEPGHSTAGPEGFRGDVLELVRELGVNVVRYPGGNFVSGYRWEDGVGPPSERPTRLDLAWRSIESNAFGTDEFVSWCRAADVEPMMAINLGTRGVQDACDLVEYCNHPDGTALSDLRIKNGAREPHDIKLWCLGNEMDGPWQIGHKTADEYGRLAAETAKAMRLVDPSIEMVACGSSNSRMPTFGQWEATVLEHAYDQVDYISAHAYYEETEGDLASFLASSVDMDSFIETVVATADHVGAKRRSRKRINLSFDEWNVWYEAAFPGPLQLPWRSQPELIEDVFHVADAVVVGSLLITLLRHADRVAVACLAQLANIIAPIRTIPGGDSWRQTIFHPFALTASHARGHVLRLEAASTTHETARYGEVALLDAVATHDPESGDVAVLAVNRSPSDDLTFELDVRAFDTGRPGSGLRLAGHDLIADNDVRASNTREAPSRVAPHPHEGTRLDGGCLTASLPPVSWSVIRLTPGPMT